MENRLLDGIKLEHTLYVIYLNVKHPVTVAIGKLGTFQFQKGLYLYIGSARRNLKARLERHIKFEKTLRWHFDYLRPHGDIVKIDSYFHGEISECQLANKMLTHHKGTFPIKSFGSSDCKCKSHLIFIEN